MSNFYITGCTNINNEPIDKLFDWNIRDSVVFTGENAGICYMKDSYYDSAVTDCEKAVKRAGFTVNTGHHSVADHYKITILFEGISKMLAIILNSLQDYTTSEKSGRYTVMAASSEQEQILYDKWIKICKNRIIELGETDEKRATKLAQENARYFLSVFTKSTTMSYTTSIRQLNYIYFWCKKMIPKLDDNIYFDKKLKEDLIWLMGCIKKSNIKCDEGLAIKDLKNREFALLDMIYPSEDNKDPIEYFDYYTNFSYEYSTRYSGTFAQLAQAQRHRTIKYHISFISCRTNEYGSDYFYTPLFIKGTEYAKEWLTDMKSVKHLIPQGTMIGIVETGDLASFLLKCDERLCSRAQLEICLQTQKTLIDYYSNIKNISIENKEKAFSKYISNGIVKTKCQILGKCNESCKHQKECFTRKF